MFERRPSDIHGSGCFANQRLVKGNQFVLGAYRVPEATYHTLECEDGTIWDLYPPFKYLNHADKPNAELVRRKGKFWLIIKKAIPADMEVTINYDSMEDM